MSVQYQYHNALKRLIYLINYFSRHSNYITREDDQNSNSSFAIKLFDEYDQIACKSVSK